MKQSARLFALSSLVAFATASLWAGPISVRTVVPLGGEGWRLWLDRVGEGHVGEGQT